MSPRRRDDHITRWVAFELAGQSYALPIERVRGVLQAPWIEPVPGTEAEVLGVLNLRGQILTVIDLRQRLGLSPAAGAGAVLVVDAPGEQLGLHVDAVRELRSVVMQAVQPSPLQAPPAGLRLCGVLLRDGVWLHLLDLAGAAT